MTNQPVRLVWNEFEQAEVVTKSTIDLVPNKKRVFSQVVADLEVGDNHHQSQFLSEKARRALDKFKRKAWRVRNEQIKSSMQIEVDDFFLPDDEKGNDLVFVARSVEKKSVDWSTQEEYKYTERRSLVKSAIIRDYKPQPIGAKSFRREKT